MKREKLASTSSFVEASGAAYQAPSLAVQEARMGMS